MKKILSIVMAFALVCSMSLVAFAEGSPSPEPAPPAPAPEAPAPGVAVVPGSNSPVAVAPWNEDGGAELASQASAVGGEIMALFDLKGTGKVTLAANVVAGRNYVLLHYLGNGKVEVLKPISVTNGAISFNITSNSAFALVEVLGGAKSPNTAAI